MCRMYSDFTNTLYSEVDLEHVAQRALDWIVVS
jgi:hypothetical protein